MCAFSLALSGRATGLVPGATSALAQQRHPPAPPVQRVDEEPAQFVQSIATGAVAASAASLGWWSCRLLHVNPLEDVPPLSWQETSAPPGPLNTSMLWHVQHWSLLTPIQCTLHTPPPPPAAEDADDAEPAVGQYTFA